MKKIVFVVGCIGIILLVVALFTVREDDVPYSSDKETVNYDDYAYSIFYNGTLYFDMGYIMDIPDDADFVGKITKVTDTPAEELECTQGEVGQNIYTFQTPSHFCIALEVASNNNQSGKRGWVIELSPEDMTSDR